MNKREERKLKAGFIMTGGVLSAISLHSWGLGRSLSWLLGFGFTAGLWIGLVWVIRKIFSQL